MKKIIRLIALLPVLFIISCGGSMKNADPKEVMTEFFKKLSQKDIEGAAKLATKDSKATLDMLKKGFDMAEKMKGSTETQEDPTEEFKNVVIGEAKIDGDVATVPFKNTKKNAEFDFPLKKEDGAWKVDFSMATLMKMGMEQAGKEGDMSGDDSDTLQKKEYNPEEVQKGLEMADSILKQMDPEKIKELQESMKKLQGGAQ